jgi:ubiquinone/menaquinone biosynthesis C-methylase UbiE
MKNYDSLYESQIEPWNYSERAIEKLRHLSLADRVKTVFTTTIHKSLLELGCSRGMQSELLLPLTQHFAAMEISAAALEVAKKRLSKIDHLGSLEFFQGSALQLPFSNNSFQLVLAADGLHEWGFSLSEKQKVYSEIYRVLQPGGIAIFSDYLKPSWFQEVLNEFQKTEFQLIDVEYFGDRPSYQLEALLKFFKNTPWAKKMIADLSLAKKLQTFGKWLGPIGSRHMMWVGKKREN